MDTPSHEFRDEAQIVAEASRQIGRQVAVRKVHVSSIRAADTVFHQGKAQTVCAKDLKSDAFMGRTLFGDSYVLGRKPVLQIVMNTGMTA